MAAAMYLITKSTAPNPQCPMVDGIHACVINSDDAGTDAVKIAEAEAAIQGAGHPIPSGYFDTVYALADLATDEDTVVILPREAKEIFA